MLLVGWFFFFFSFLRFYNGSLIYVGVPRRCKRFSTKEEETTATLFALRKAKDFGLDKILRSFFQCLGGGESFSGD